MKGVSHRNARRIAESVMCRGEKRQGPVGDLARSARFLIERPRIMKRVATSISIGVFLILAAASTGCTKADAVADAKEMAATKANHSATPSPETLVMPAGTSFLAVLDSKLSTDSNKDGDPFVATTVEPIVIEGKTVVPAGTRGNRRLRGRPGAGRH